MAVFTTQHIWYHLWPSEAGKVTAGIAESNGSQRVWLTSTVGCLPSKPGDQHRYLPSMRDYEIERSLLHCPSHVIPEQVSPRRLCHMYHTNQSSHPGLCTSSHMSFIPLLPNYLPICISIFSGHFPDEPGLATPLVFFLQLFQKRTFRINAETFMCQICPSCHPTNSVKALTPTSGPASSYLHPPLGLLCPGTLLPCYPIR